METKTGFTVFTEDGWQDSDPEFGITIQELSEWLLSEGLEPIAWCEGSAFGRATSARAESLTAGRTIELIDGKYVARGVEEPKPAQTLGDLLRKAGQGLPSKTPTLDKLEAEHAGNAAMIARDGPAKQTFIRFTCVDCTGCAKCAPVSTAKPALSFLTLSPDLQPSSHLVAPAHGSALLRG